VPVFCRDSVVVRVQMLAELEEIIRYKELQGQHDAQQFLRMTWNKRYAGQVPYAGLKGRILTSCISRCDPWAIGRAQVEGRAA